jgi:predicted ArsR family transcriptional regulator
MSAMSNTSTDIGAVALLDEPVRRALYEYVVRSGRAISRDEAATATGVSRPLAAFHLDRLAAGGLLVAEYRRLSGRTGPGAGRPAKLYRRAPGDVVVSLPDRRYEVPALVFAETIEQMAGTVPPDTLRASARRVGEAAGSAARKRAGARAGRRQRHTALVEALRERGYAPLEAESGEIRFANCPFHSLVDEHRPLVCGMNLALTEGLIDRLGDAVEARLDPQPGFCCVAITPKRADEPSKGIEVPSVDHDS